MKRLTPREKFQAFQSWYRNYEYQENDREIEAYNSVEIKSYEKGSGWLRKARKSLFLSGKRVAEKMGLSQQAYSQLERREDHGGVTIEALSRAAEAMGCELVYAIRPKKRVKFSTLIWRKLLAFSLKHPWAKKCDQKRRHDGIAAIARNAMAHTEFRRNLNWSQKRPP